ncbi:MAG: Trk system potassium transporter TrkA [Phycisphaerales bacterium]|nr:MAG: Trk system potassium transporter TrkA [Phycisphaerales bacterium]
MNVIIAGAGEFGGHAAEVLSADGHKVTVIDVSTERLGLLNDKVDVRTLAGNCAHFQVVAEAGVEHCDLLIAATETDEINLFVACVAKASGAKKTIVRVHHTANFELRGRPLAEKLGIDELICPEHLVALAITRTLRNPGSIALEEFGRGKLLMQRFPVIRGATAVGKKLHEIRLPASARLATVEGKSGVAIANAETEIDAGDLVTLIGERKTFESARKVFHKGKEKRLLVAVMGETSTAAWLCRSLKSRMFSVRLFVQQHQRAVELSEKLPHVTVLEADPTDATTFADEHIEKTNAFIAVTEDDEYNILACAQAKKLGVATAFAIVTKEKYLHLFPSVGIDHAFIPRTVAVSAIQHMLAVGRIRSLATFANGIAEVYEIRPSKRAKILGNELRNVQLPAETMIAAIRRGNEVYVPGAEDRFTEDDTILAIGPCGIADDLLKLFVSK